MNPREGPIMKMKSGILVVVVMMALGFVLSTGARGLGAEKKYPIKPIQVVIAFQPGETDNILRPFVEKLPEYLGQPVSFIYKPGAAGSVGAGFVAKAKPDGYTLIGTSQSSVVINPLTQKDVGYTWDSFVPIGVVAEGTLILALQANARWKTLNDLVEEAKKNPGRISYTSPGTLNIMHLGTEAFCEKAGIQLNHIPAQGSGPAVTAMLGGHVDLASTGLSPAIAHIKAGTVRVLAVFNDKRKQALPGVPTFLEMGYPAVVTTKVGFLAPKGTPQEVIETLHGALKKVVENHQAFINERIDKIGSEVDFMGPAEHEAFLKKENDFFEIAGFFSKPFNVENMIEEIKK